MDALWKDLSVAIRQFRRQPGFALAVVSTLALAIGANIAVFSVVNAVLFRALPSRRPSGWCGLRPCVPTIRRRHLHCRNSWTTAARHARSPASPLTPTCGQALPERPLPRALQGARISANGFDVLGVTPAAGRLLRESDDRPGAAKVAVLSYRLWQRRFVARPRLWGGACG